MPVPRAIQRPTFAPPSVNLFLRAVEPKAAGRMKTAARARGLALGPYVVALFKLHEAIRERADAGNDELQKLLRQLGLESVRV